MIHSHTHQQIKPLVTLTSEPHTPTLYDISLNPLPHFTSIMFPLSHDFNIAGEGLEQMLHHPHMPSPMEHQQQHHQQLQLLRSSSSSSSRWKPRVEVAPNCPRCASTNTKFCYYNNYSLSQPRYFCKGCRRYWTKGGSLRNVPVGGGCRKNRRGKSSRNHHTQRPFGCVSEDRESSMGDVDGDGNGDGDGDAHENNNGSRDIDMALVFAKFLNPKPSTRTEDLESEANNGSSSTSNNNYLTPESVEACNNIKPLSDPIIEEGEELSLSHGIDELERLLDEDALWSDPTLSSSVSWQPKPMQLQEFEYSMMPFDDYAQLLPITSSSSAMSDTCWSSFDLSTMEMFSSTP